MSGLDPQPLIIIPCGQKKLNRPAPAAELYTGSYFRACLKYARSRVPDARIRILSACHGFMFLDVEREPYNLRLGEPGAVSLDLLRQQARLLKLDQEPHVVALGGRDYVGLCRQVWPHAVTPLDGKGGIGAQIGWLTREARP